MPVDWFAENLRLTLLGVVDWVQRPIFAEIAGVPPAHITAQPPVQIHQEMGNVHDAYLSVSQQAGRLDIVLTDQPTRNTSDSGAPDYRPLFWVGPLKDSLDKFDPIISKAISMQPRATRLAYAITVIRQAQSIREANACLRRYLPTVQFDPDRDTDLIFQINRPIQTNSKKAINRLARWEAIQTQRIQVAIGTPVIPALQPAPTVFAARVYVDISTDTTNTVPFARSDIPELVNELRDQAISIIEHGDGQ